MVSHYAPFTVAPPQQGVVPTAGGNHHSNVQAAHVQYIHPGIHSHQHNQMQQQQQAARMQIQGSNPMHVSSLQQQQQQLHHQQQTQQHQQKQMHGYHVLVPGPISSKAPKTSSHNAQIQPKTVQLSASTNLPATATSSNSYRLNPHTRDSIKTNGV